MMILNIIGWALVVLCVGGGIAVLFEAVVDWDLFTSPIMGFCGLLLVACAVGLTGIIVGWWQIHPDPCRRIVSTGKVTVVYHVHGWQSDGGRPVWCGPGPVPNQ